MQVTRVGITLQKNYSQAIQGTPQVHRAPLNRDVFIKSGMPSFGKYITNTWEFKQLTQNHVIHCPYCKRPMLYGGTLTQMQRDGLFSGPIIDFVNAIIPYKKVLKKGHKQVFSAIAKYAQKEPQAELSTVIQSMYLASIKKLQRQQAKIFGELFEASKELPENLNNSFRAFMRIQHKRLFGRPHNEDFKLKPFIYKISKMYQTIHDDAVRTSIKSLIKSFIENTGKDLSSPISEKEIRYIIDTIQGYGERLDRQDIISLCDTSRKMLNGENVIVPFSNKEFTHDLAKHQLKTLKKTPLYKKMIKIANRLPSSENNKNSFIVKNKYANSDTIGYKLLEPSTTTIEHIKPRSKNGADELWNMALACMADNIERQNTLQSLYLRKWPKKNPQIYFDDIIHWTNKEEIFHPTTVEQMANSFWEQGQVSIDTSKLRGTKSHTLISDSQKKASQNRIEVELKPEQPKVQRKQKISKHETKRYSPSRSMKH